MKSISEYIKQQNSIRLLAVGDITAHDCILNDLKFNGIYNFMPIFKHVKPIIQQSDIAFCNQ